MEPILIMQQQVADLMGDGEAPTRRSMARVNTDDRPVLLLDKETREVSIEMLVVDARTEMRGDAFHGNRRPIDTESPQELCYNALDLGTCRHAVTTPSSLLLLG
jgi:hypothetical protein